MESLSKKDARKIVLQAQQLSAPSKYKGGLSKTLAVLEKLNYVQIDTISVVQRAHHHVLWSRNSEYKLAHLEKLVEQKSAFEYWSHAAAYLPMRDYRFSLPRKMAFKTGQQNHWYKQDLKLMNEVISRITSEGPLMAKDFESTGVKRQGWGSKPTKQALECLFMQGDLMISERRNFHKVYDLTERVLPEGIDTSIPSDLEFGKHLINRYLAANGVGTVKEIAYLLKGVQPLLRQALEQLIEEGTVIEVQIECEPYLTTPEALTSLNERLYRKQFKLLSPFDNLLIQRQRMVNLFSFQYQLECYVPESKRQFGYFGLPILWKGELVGQADCKVDKPNQQLNVLNLYLTSKATKSADLEADLAACLDSFARFNQCHQYQIEKLNHL